MKYSDKASFCENEKRIVKALLNNGERNQDVQSLVNMNRKSTVNFARISEVKANSKIIPADQEEVKFYKKYRHSFDPITGLNHYDDEKLIRAREAMLLAVHIFNSPTLLFKTEVFSMLANVAWTYILHVYYEEKGVKTINAGGYGLLLSEMLKRGDCPLTKETIANLEALKEIRDAVVHTFFSKADQKFSSIYQATCLNFDRALCQLFSERVSLKNELSFSLQFAKMDFEQLSQLTEYDIPENIKTLSKSLDKKFENYQDSVEYQFAVNYEFVSATKANAHVNFKNNAEDFDGPISNALVKKVVSDDGWPHRASIAAKLIEKKSGKAFSVNNHTSAWRYFDVRPPTKAKSPVNTKKEYCIYHKAHKD